MPAISVIVPIYNIEDYLGECLESIAQQSFTDFEALCVVDGGEDGSRAIAERMAAEDERFVVLVKENGGLSSARNYGLDHARGDIVVFVDGDDSIEPNCLERVHASLNATGADALVFGATPDPADAANQWLVNCLSPRQRKGEPFSPEFMFSIDTTPYVWRTAVRRSLLEAEKLRFDEGLPFGEDVVFQFALYPRATKLASIPDKLYRYRLDRSGSLMDGHQGVYKRLSAHARIVEAVFREWRQLGLIERYAHELFEWSVPYLMRDIDQLPEGQRGECKAMANELWNEYFPKEGACPARVETSCLCRGDGKLYVECAIEAAPFDDLQVRAYAQGAEVPVGAYPLSRSLEGRSQVWALELPWLATPTVDVFLRPDGRAAEQTAVKFRYLKAKWLSRLNYRTRADRSFAIRDIEREFTSGRFQVMIDRRFQDGADAVWRFVVRWIGPSDVKPRFEFMDGRGAPLDLSCVPLEFQPAPAEGLHANQLFVSVRTTCTHFIMVASDESGAVERGFATVDPTVDEGFAVGTAEFMRAAGEDDGAYRFWLESHQAKRGELDAQRRASSPADVSLCVVVDAVYGDVSACAETLRSLAKQTYGSWNVIVLGLNSPDEAASALPDYRVQWVPNAGLRRFEEAVAATNAAYLAFLEAGDVLEPDALFAFAEKAKDAADVVFSDEDAIEAPGLFSNPTFKSKLNLDLLYSSDWIGSSFVIRRELLQGMPPCEEAALPAWAYDRILRACEQNARFVQVPRVLLHVSRSSTDEGRACARREALASHLLRRGIAADVEAGPFAGTARICYKTPEPAPLVSIIIPSKDQADLLEACIRSLVERSTYRSFEIVVVENNSEQPDTEERYAALECEFSQVRIVHWPGAFNFSGIINFGVSQARGDLLLFLNNDTELIEPDSIGEMAGILQRHEVGVVGAKLFFKDGLVQHSGMAVGPFGVVVHVNQNRGDKDGGYQGRACLTGQYTAVTGACQMVRRDAFGEVGGYNERFAVGFNDVDFCMRLQEAGYLVVYTPYAQFYHYEFASRGRELVGDEKMLRWKRECALFTELWPAPFVEGDPYTSSNLARDNTYYQLNQR